MSTPRIIGAAYHTKVLRDDIANSIVITEDENGVITGTIYSSFVGAAVINKLVDDGVAVVYVTEEIARTEYGNADKRIVHKSAKSKK